MTPTLISSIALLVSLAILYVLRKVELKMADLTTAVTDVETAMDAMKSTIDSLRNAPPGGLTYAQAQALADSLEAKIQVDNPPVVTPVTP